VRLSSRVVEGGRSAGHPRDASCASCVVCGSSGGEEEEGESRIDLLFPFEQAEIDLTLSDSDDEIIVTRPAPSVSSPLSLEPSCCQRRLADLRLLFLPFLLNSLSTARSTFSRSSRTVHGNQGSLSAPALPRSTAL
jgi:hypothetical protein